MANKKKTIKQKEDVSGDRFASIGLFFIFTTFLFGVLYISELGDSRLLQMELSSAEFFLDQAEIRNRGLEHKLMFVNNKSQVLEVFENLKQMNTENIAESLYWKEKYSVCYANLNSLKEFELTPLEVESRNDVRSITCLYNVQMWDNQLQESVSTNNYELTTNCYEVIQE